MDQIKHTFHNYRVSDQKREFLNQRAVAIWITGLPASGKSTLASNLEEALLAKGYFTQWLDGDYLRNGLTKDLGFTDTDQEENIRRCAEVAKLFLESNIITICTFISASERLRNIARDIIGTSQFLEVYANCPLEVCVQRDGKNMYGRALRGGITNLSGVDFPYEPPRFPWLQLYTSYHSEEDCSNQLLEALLPRIKI
ncbi:adenylyl-sulfate kinase [Adhaeribacter aerolatus]|uniref:Adenylyl-sulfate kinase n=1 Tax=Adhaeribacter aerolatus TaxID=670289 RepID=A0A512AT86_9BACT|nr:adenylyl-sulfate kinase [Adhaeribacter aerolatus]GEO02929.1 adenylyl-sulfate kinase [Adhaeribacter aerolatus]